MVIVSLLDRQRTRDRARPRPNAPGNFITASFFATVYTLTFPRTPQNYIKWWPYKFPETRALGYKNDPAIKPAWVPLGPVTQPAGVYDITGAILPGSGELITLPAPIVPLIPPPISPTPIITPTPISPVVAQVPALLPGILPAGAGLIAETAHKPGKTGTVVIGIVAKQISPSAFPIRGVTILADNLNALNIWIGYDPQVAANLGFKLIPGAAKDLNIDDLSAVWLIGENAADKIHFEYTV